LYVQGAELNMHDLYVRRTEECITEEANIDNYTWLNYHNANVD